MDVVSYSEKFCVFRKTLLFETVKGIYHTLFYIFGLSYSLEALKEKTKNEVKFDIMSVRVLLLVLLIMVCFCVCTANADDEVQETKPSLREWQRLKSAYSAYVGLFSPSSVAQSGWYTMLKNLLNHAYLRLFPPNIDFRREEKEEGEGGAGEKAIEALGNSLENAAKSAAQTLHNVKNTFSPSHSQSDTDTKTHHEL
ncbi:hypothetical protein VNO80_00034 [Phaseolus coccineus]|uniref:Uncharacterized protein n=1 Tax=Phaseolus coccineus TaxID=3886 RepID=A0AAN9NZC9_PHACN